MKALPLSNDTHDRAVRLQELDNMGSDSLVNLALDAYEIMRERETGNLIGRDGSPTPRQWGERFAAVAAGSHYVEIAQPVAEPVLIAGTTCPHCQLRVHLPAHSCHVSRRCYEVRPLSEVPEPIASRKAPPA